MTFLYRTLKASLI